MTDPSKLTKRMQKTGQKGRSRTIPAKTPDERQDIRYSLDIPKHLYDQLSEIAQQHRVRKAVIVRAALDTALNTHLNETLDKLDSYNPRHNPT